jgi:AAHS family 4-hydroxybenzoate transporter-like MFS transporter
MAVGTFLGGLGGDRWGRKPSLVASVLLFGAASGLTSLAHTPLEIGVLRFISGMGIGGALPNASTLAAEFTPARKRAMAVTCTIVCVPLGGLAGGLLAAEVLPSLGWRALYVMAGAAPLVIALVLWLLLPESPSFLARRPARSEELNRFLRRCGPMAQADVRFAAHAPIQASGRKRGLRALFEPFYARDTAFLWLVFFSAQAGVYLIFTWLPTLLADRGFGLGVTSMGLTATNLGGVIGALVGAWAIEAFGSRRAMTALALGATASAGVLYFVHIAPGGTLMGLIGLLAVQGFFLNGVQTTVYALTAHVYLADVRATGSGTALAVGRAGGIFSAFAGAALLADAGRPFFAALAIVMALAAVGLLLVGRHIPPQDAA